MDDVSARELVDVIDDDGDVARVVTRAEMRAGRLRHRCTFVLVRSTRGEVLIHRRADHKDMWPGRWDTTCGGVVAAGEEWEAAARRELAEELGIVAELEYVGGGAYRDRDVDEIAEIWQVVHDGPFEFTDDEVVEARFVTLDELRTRLSVDSFVPDSTAMVAYPLLGLDTVDDDAPPVDPGPDAGWFVVGIGAEIRAQWRG